jgi:hypothetical protein
MKKQQRGWLFGIGRFSSWTTCLGLLCLLLTGWLAVKDVELVQQIKSKIESKSTGNSKSVSTKTPNAFAVLPFPILLSSTMLYLYLIMVIIIII